MKGDIAVAGFRISAEEWRLLDLASRAQLVAVITRREDPALAAGSGPIAIDLEAGSGGIPLEIEPDAELTAELLAHCDVASAGPLVVPPDYEALEYVPDVIEPEPEYENF